MEESNTEKEKERDHKKILLIAIISFDCSNNCIHNMQCALIRYEKQRT